MQYDQKYIVFSSVRKESVVKLYVSKFDKDRVRMYLKDEVSVVVSTKVLSKIVTAAKERGQEVRPVVVDSK